jgi:hypothetical protein
VTRGTSSVEGQLTAIVTGSHDAQMPFHQGARRPASYVVLGPFAQDQAAIRDTT